MSERNGVESMAWFDAGVPNGDHTEYTVCLTVEQDNAIRLRTAEGRQIEEILLSEITAIREKDLCAKFNAVVMPPSQSNNESDHS